MASKLRLSFGPASLILALGLAPGCSNPTADAPAATVNDPAPTPAAADSATPSPVASAPAPALTPAEGERFAFSGEGSTIGFVGSKAVGGSHDGGFKAFQGAFVVDTAARAVKAVEATIDMNSTWADNDKLTGHLKNQDFFEVETYPEAKFVSTAIEPAADTSKGATHDVTGDFTLHGVTKSIGFPATIAVTDDSTTLDSEFSIKRGDFGIVYGNVGDNMIRDEVLIKLALKAARPAASLSSGE